MVQCLSIALYYRAVLSIIVFGSVGFYLGRLPSTIGLFSQFIAGAGFGLYKRRLPSTIGLFSQFLLEMAKVVVPSVDCPLLSGCSLNTYVDNGDGQGFRRLPSTIGLFSQWPPL